MYSDDTLAQGGILSKTYGKFLMLNWVWSLHVYKNHCGLVISAIQNLR